VLCPELLALEEPEDRDPLQVLPEPAELARDPPEYCGAGGGTVLRGGGVVELRAVAAGTPGVALRGLAFAAAVAVVLSLAAMLSFSLGAAEFELLFEFTKRCSFGS
jgi:hypothetical protein